MGLFEEQLAHSIYLLIIIANGDAMAGKRPDFGRLSQLVWSPKNNWDVISKYYNIWDILRSLY